MGELEVLAPAKELPVRVLHPLRDHRFVTEVMQLFEQEQTHHQPHRLRWTSFPAVAIGKGFLESRPRQGLSQPVEWLPGVKLLAQRRHEKGALVGGGGFGSHLRFDQLSTHFLWFPVAPTLTFRPPTRFNACSKAFFRSD